MSRDGEGIDAGVLDGAEESAAGPAIVCRDVVKYFGHLEALRGATLTVRRGEVLALLGDNGAGKTTLVKCISGAYQIDGGDIRVMGEQVEASTRSTQERGVQTIYQNLALADDLSVVENVFLGREKVLPGWRGRLGIIDSRAMREETVQAAKRMGVRLRSGVEVSTRDLSGGQRQIVAIMRAVPWASTAIMMDEPTAALGARQRQIVYDVARQVADGGVAVLMISHDIPQMVEFADRVAVMRQGRVVAERPASELDTSSVMSLMLGGTV